MPKKIKELKRYYKRGIGPAEGIILKELKTDPDMILHGNRAINKQLPEYLQIYTEDYDILSANPRVDARRIERLLDERYGGNYFKVELGKHPGTFKVRSKVTHRVVTDLTKLDVDVPTKEIDGIKVATLEHHLERIKITLKDPKKEFRWIKDRETRQRILLHKGKK